MKVLVTGAKGLLGSDVMDALKKRGHLAVGVDIQELDITERDKVLALVEREKPDAVIHCAAWTAVDAAEEEANKEICHRINVDGTRFVAEACKAVGAKMLYLSTDYVFDGQGSRPWEPDDPVSVPLNYYGLTKYEGEQAIVKNIRNYFIVRIAWVFGVNGKNFVRTMVTLGKNHDQLTVVNDQIGTPTFTYDLARLLVDMIETDKYGYYHVTNEGDYISWYDYACEIFRQTGQEVKVVPVSSAEYGAQAVRPFNSRMNRSRLKERGFTPLPDWKDALRRYLEQTKNDI